MNTTTKEIFYSKGATKIAQKVGIDPTTVINRSIRGFSLKEYNGYILSKTTDISNKRRGKPINKL